MNDEALLGRGVRGYDRMDRRIDRRPAGRVRPDPK